MEFSEKSEKVDRTLNLVLARVVRLVILAITIIAVLERFGVPIASFVALLGAAGLAIGLALQGTLTNIASGVMLLTLRPFKVGEAIDAGGTLGIIEDIGLFATQMRSFEGIAMFVPNSRLWGSEIRNFTRTKKRRIDLVFGIAYGDDINKAFEVIQDVLASEERVLEDPAPLLAVGDLGDSSVDLWVRPWTLGPDFFMTMLDLRKRIKERFEEEGITIPFPQRDIHVIEQAIKDAPRQQQRVAAD